MNLGEEVTGRAVEALVADGRTMQRVPDAVRARLLARARAHVDATSGAVLVPTAVIAPAAWRGWRMAFAVAAILAFSAAGAAAALFVRGSAAPEAAAPPAPRSLPSLPAPAPRLPALEPEPPPPPSVAPERAHRPLSPQESYAAELSLLQRAHSEYNGGGFRSALGLLSEHARRFPNGRLAEEREALRVRSLEAAGRDSEARRALAAFGKRFPRSALLPRLRERHAADSRRDP